MNSERETLLKVLQIEKNGDWDQAHRIVQTIGSRDGSRVHAYLHRREGDLGNALYWYHQADCNAPTISLDEEWKHLADGFSPDP